MQQGGSEPSAHETTTFSSANNLRAVAMDSIIFTPRLKLTLLTKAEMGSPQLDWLHELHSNEKSTWWRYVLSLFTQVVEANP